MESFVQMDINNGVFIIAPYCISLFSVFYAENLMQFFAIMLPQKYKGLIHDCQPYEEKNTLAKSQHSSCKCTSF